MGHLDVTLRTARDKVLVFLGEEPDFQAALSRLRSKIRDNAEIGSRSDVMVDIGKRVLTEEEFLALQKTVQEDLRLRLTRVVDSIDMASKPSWWPIWSVDEDARADVLVEPDEGPEGASPEYVVREGPLHAPPEFGVVLEENGGARGEPEYREVAWQRGLRRGGGEPDDAVSFSLYRDQVPSQPNAYLVKATMRSGQTVLFDGDVVVLGDVNGGAEVIASGDVVVVGTLRGVAHAGSRGNREATITAMRLEPTQLRLADFIARPPDGESVRPRGPEMARVVDGAVVITRVDRYFPTISEGGGA
jgi:septum site-determining protein MinC